MNFPLRHLLRPLAAIVLLLPALPSASAEPVDVENFSFENPVKQEDKWGPINEGWTPNPEKPGQSGTQNFTDAQFTGASAGPLPAPGDGDQAAYIFPGGYLCNQVGPLKPNTTYTLTVAVGTRTDAPPNGAELILANGPDPDANMLASTICPQVAQGTFEDFTLEFTSGATVQGDLFIFIRCDKDKPRQTQVDNVRLDARPVNGK